MVIIEKKIRDAISSELYLDKLYISSSNDHLEIIAIGNIFTGLDIVKRQKIIYQPITKYIVSNIIHSVSIMTYTLEEWVNKQNTNV